MLLMASAALCLAGCEAQSNGLPSLEPTLVIAPGFEIEVAGNPIPVRGLDPCPAQNSLMDVLFGPQEAEEDCIVLSDDRNEVAVLVYFDDGHALETWEIIRDTGKSKSGRFFMKTSLKRPDGSLVVPAIR